MGKVQGNDEPIYLAVGTEVSAKYKGAFCEAKVSKVSKLVRCKVNRKSGQGPITVVDDQIVRGNLQIGAVVTVKISEKKENFDAIITKIQDCSQYTVVFDDGDIATLRRSALCLKSGRHYNESESLDQLPLINPEHFSVPVNSRRGRRNQTPREENTDDELYDEIDTELATLVEHIGKVYWVEGVDKKKLKDSWYPCVIVSPNAQPSSKINLKEEFLVRCFKDGRFYTVPREEIKDFTKDSINKYGGENDATKKALAYLDSNALPQHWDSKELFYIRQMEADSDEISDDNEEDENEEKDLFVAKLFKFLDDRGTSMNKMVKIGNKDVDLYRLHKIVRKLGGYNKVVAKSKWPFITNRLNFPITSKNILAVRDVYKNWILAYVEFFRKLGCTMLDAPVVPSKKPFSRSLIREKDRVTPVNSPRFSENSADELVSTDKKDDSDDSKSRLVRKAKASRPKSQQAQRTASVDTEVEKSNSEDENASKATTTTKDNRHSDHDATDYESRERGKNLNSKKNTKNSKTTTSTKSSSNNKDDENVSKAADSALTVSAAAAAATAAAATSTSSASTNATNSAATAAAVASAGTTGTTSDNEKKRGRKKKPGSANKLKPILNIGDEVLVDCRDGKEKGLYPAKIMKIDKNDPNGNIYYIHYLGWNARYDRWISADKIITKDNDIESDLDNSSTNTASSVSSSTVASSSSPITTLHASTSGTSAAAKQGTAAGTSDAKTAAASNQSKSVTKRGPKKAISLRSVSPANSSPSATSSSSTATLNLPLKTNKKFVRKRSLSAAIKTDDTLSDSDNESVASSISTRNKTIESRAKIRTYQRKSRKLSVDSDVKGDSKLTVSVSDNDSKFSLSNPSVKLDKLTMKAKKMKSSKVVVESARKFPESTVRKPLKKSIESANEEKEQKPLRSKSSTEKGAVAAKDANINKTKVDEKEKTVTSQMDKFKEPVQSQAADLNSRNIEIEGEVMKEKSPERAQKITNNDNTNTGVTVAEHKDTEYVDDSFLVAETESALKILSELNPEPQSTIADMHLVTGNDVGINIDVTTIKHFQESEKCFKNDELRLPENDRKEMFDELAPLDICDGRKSQMQNKDERMNDEEKNDIEEQKYDAEQEIENGRGLERKEDDDKQKQEHQSQQSQPEEAELCVAEVEGEAEIEIETVVVVEEPFHDDHLEIRTAAEFGLDIEEVEEDLEEAEEEQQQEQIEHKLLVQSPISSPLLQHRSVTVIPPLVAMLSPSSHSPACHASSKTTVAIENDSQSECKSGTTPKSQPSSSIPTVITVIERIPLIDLAIQNEIKEDLKVREVTNDDNSNEEDDVNDDAEDDDVGKDEQPVDGAAGQKTLEDERYMNRDFVDSESSSSTISDTEIPEPKNSVISNISNLLCEETFPGSPTPASAQNLCSDSSKYLTKNQRWEAMRHNYEEEMPFVCSVSNSSTIANVAAQNMNANANANATSTFSNCGDNSTTANHGNDAAHNISAVKNNVEEDDGVDGDNDDDDDDDDEEDEDGDNEEEDEDDEEENRRKSNVMASDSSISGAAAPVKKQSPDQFNKQKIFSNRKSPCSSPESESTARSNTKVSTSTNNLARLSNKNADEENENKPTKTSVPLKCSPSINDDANVPFSGVQQRKQVASANIDFSDLAFLSNQRKRKLSCRDKEQNLAIKRTKHTEEEILDRNVNYLLNKYYKPPKNRLFETIDPSWNQEQRIEFIKSKISEIRELHQDVKGELARLDRRRKRARRRREKEGKSNKQVANHNPSNSALNEKD